MRRVLAFVLALGLVPGITGGLLEGGAHCSHACCQGQEFCHRGTGHDHGDGAQHDMAGHHGGHVPAPQLAITAIEPPSASCLETCGVLPDLRPKTEAASRAKQVAMVQQVRPAPSTVNFVAETGSLSDPASPVGLLENTSSPPSS